MRYPVICAYCEKNHNGVQTYNDELKDYVCLECEEILNKQKDVK